MGISNNVIEQETGKPMTYSILAKCPATGRYGLGIATYSVAVGQWCDGLDRYSGATMSQAFVRTTNNALALNGSVAVSQLSRTKAI